MAEDPDYIDPAELKRRAAVNGGAGVKPGRPRLRRPAEPSASDGGIRVAKDVSTVRIKATSAPRPIEIKHEARGMTISR